MTSQAAEFRNSASFRDPAGFVAEVKGEILRVITKEGIRNWNTVVERGAISSLMRAGLLIQSTSVPVEDYPALKSAAALFRSEKIPFVSYPYEWNFSQIKDAALHHLQTHLLALEHGATLSDGSIYNVQFIGSRPVFIDLLSVVPYEEGDYWDGYNQFCRHFLYPLLLTSQRKVPANEWLKSNLEGITADQLDRLIPWYQKLRPGIFLHLHVAAKLERYLASAPGKSERLARATKLRPFSSFSLRALLTGLQKLILRLKPPHTITTWGTYDKNNTYVTEEELAKCAFVVEAFKASGAKTAVDIGCNTGFYSEAILKAGAQYVIGLDSDQMALEQASRRAKEGGLAFLPLFIDLSNPSPSQGWNGLERQSFQSRARFQFVAALAIIHHLAIARNLPLVQVVDHIVSLAPYGVIEWVEKNDTTVQKMLATRCDVFPDYSIEALITAIEARASIVATKIVSKEKRTLFYYQRHQT